MPLNTANTTRIPENSPVELSVAVSRLLWPCETAPSTPNVVILAPDNLFSYSYMASSMLYAPLLGTKLLMPTDELPEITLSEINRLSPRGGAGLPPIIMIGPFDEAVIQRIESVGYPVLHIMGKTVFATAAHVARIRQEVPPTSTDGNTSLFIVSADNPFGGMPVSYYSARSGVPVLFTYPDRLPRATVKLLEEMNDRYVYVVGSRRSLAPTIESEINSIMTKPARRIGGRNPFDTAVLFASYYDAETGLGWRRNKQGHGDAFTFTNLDRWELADAGSPLAVSGKHTPLLLVEENRLPIGVRDYLDFLRPAVTPPSTPPFMHGFILGDDHDLSFKAQAEIEKHLRREYSEK